MSYSSCHGFFCIPSNLLRPPSSGRFRTVYSSFVPLISKVRCIENTDRCPSISKSSINIQNKSRSIVCAIHMPTGGGESSDHRKTKLNQILNGAYKAWESLPLPVKNFPWNRALDNFIQLVLDLILAVLKLLSIPLLAITSLSEMSYCAHEKKLFLLPLLLLTGAVLAGVFKETALEASPLLKEADVPWHLISIAVIFTLMKSPGPYYPYWGRILIPHLANGGLVRTLWFAFEWYRKAPKEALHKTLHQHSSSV